MVCIVVILYSTLYKGSMFKSWETAQLQKRVENIMDNLKEVNQDWNVLDLEWVCGLHGAFLVLYHTKNKFYIANKHFMTLPFSFKNPSEPNSYYNSMVLQMSQLGDSDKYPLPSFGTENSLDDKLNSEQNLDKKKDQKKHKKHHKKHKKHKKHHKKHKKHSKE